MHYNTIKSKLVQSIFLVTAILATTGCSSMLTIGSSDSDDCKGVPESKNFKRSASCQNERC